MPTRLPLSETTPIHTCRDVPARVYWCHFTSESPPLRSAGFSGKHFRVESRKGKACTSFSGRWTIRDVRALWVGKPMPRSIERRRTEREMRFSSRVRLRQRDPERNGGSEGARRDRWNNLEVASRAPISSGCREAASAQRCAMRPFKEAGRSALRLASALA